MFLTYQNEIENLKDEIENYKKRLKYQEESFNTVLEDETGSPIFLSVISDKIQTIKQTITNKEKQIKEITLKISN